MTKPTTHTDFKKIWAEADDKAAEAAYSYLTDHGDHADCGSCVLVVPTGKYRKLAKWIEETHPSRCMRSGGYSGMPACLWVNYSRAMGVQSRIIFEKAASAACTVFRDSGFDQVHLHSWAD